MTLADKPLNVLVIEDNEGDSILFEACLLQTKLNVKKLFHAEAIEQAKAFQKQIDIAFLDLSLPDSVGTESFTRLNLLFPQVPIVVLSGLSDEKIAVECIALGAQDYLLKNELTERLLEKSVHYSLERKKNLEELRNINRQYELIGTVTNDVIWNWNLGTNEIAGATKAFFGYGQDEVGKHLDWWVDKIHPADKDKVVFAIKMVVEGKAENIQEEYRFRSADSSYKYVFTRGILLGNENNAPYEMIGTMMDITERRKLQEELINSQLLFQKQITEATILGQEKEKEEIGKELHDNINQILASSKLYLDIAINDKHMREELLPICKENILSAIDEIRKLSHSLIPPSLGDYGLIDAVKELIEDLNRIGRLKAHLSIDNFDECFLSENKKLMLYRVVQEQMNNIIKYAKAREVFVVFKILDEKLFLTISDNGVGFDTTKKFKGIGLRNINSRVSYYSGDVQIISAPGKGTSLEVHLPV